tara:strand:- start:47 stop:469 length:423 start_codon:yes stop_codon:yes gene_type:complete
MNVTKQNVWLDALIAALAAKQSHAKALANLIAHHGGKRTLPLMEDLLSGIRALHPATKAELSVRNVNGVATPNVSFPDKGVGYETWKDMILPHLPKLRAATGGKKSNKTSPRELALARVKSLKSQGFTKAQLLAAIELLF